MLLKLILIIVISFFSLLNAEEKIGMYEKQGTTIPLDIEFTNEYNKKVTLKDAIDNKPTVFTFNYFDCPGLCSPLLNGVADVLNKLELKPFIDYKAITISIEPTDTPEKASIKKESLLDSIKKPFPPQTWSFLTTSKQKSIDEITNAVGFYYEKRVKDGVTDYLHPGLIVIVSPKGKIIRYLNGIEFLPFDVKLALLEASEETSRPTIAKTLLYCFAYDAKNKTYVFQAEKIVGILMFSLVLIFFIYLVRSGRKSKKDDSDE